MLRNCNNSCTDMVHTALVGAVLASSSLQVASNVLQAIRASTTNASIETDTGVLVRRMPWKLLLAEFRVAAVAR